MATIFYLQTIFFYEYFCILMKISLIFDPHGPINSIPALGSDNSLVPVMQQAIIWTNDGQSLMTYISLDLNELRTCTSYLINITVLMPWLHKNPRHQPLRKWPSLNIQALCIKVKWYYHITTMKRQKLNMINCIMHNNIDISSNGSQRVVYSLSFITVTS